MKRLAIATLGAVVVVGCVKQITRPPAEAFVTLGGKKAPYRAWSRVADLCAVDPAQFTSEQQALTAVLADWLGQTSAAADGAWDDEHIALLEEGVRVLPPALALQQEALDKVTQVGCNFTGLASSAELNAQARRRIEAAPALLEQVKARLALAKWKEARPAQQQTAKDNACNLKMKPTAPILYFAAEDETAALEWLFCDGAKVVASPGNPPSFVKAPVDPNAKKPKKAEKEPDAKVWLDLAAKYPSESVSRAPKLPRKKLGRDDGAAEPE